LEELLNIAPSGVEDDLFELGGDSMIFIQVISAARPLGIRLTPDALYDHSTISALAAVAEVVSTRHVLGIDGDDELDQLRRQFSREGDRT
jgi:aryl carrier-like protein